MSSAQSSGAVDTARDYYDSEDADNFYALIWGGEDIHIGLYESDQDSIYDASRRTVAKMAASIAGLDARTRVLDVGSGYGGAARFLAGKYGCQVVALNLSEVENRRARMLNQEQGLASKIDVVEGSFEALPYPDASFDVVWSQDAILHSGQRAKVISEVSRVLKPGGEFIFTDPMQSDSCPDGVLQPILDRIHLQSLGSPAFYRQQAAVVGLEEVEFADLTFQLVNHYARIGKETEARVEKLSKRVSSAYIERMMVGLQRWVEGGKLGHLCWGIFHFRKA